ncbi:MAG: adenosine kinase [Tritonibacter mobilis]|nr:adenosine kinase [Tritonibacter mobilis]
MNERYDVVGIGNALVDVLARVEDEFLAENGVEKGIMTLIDTARAAELYSRMGPATEISGGSGANTIAGLAMLGSRAAYVGKVKDDQLGAIFAHDLRALGATFETPMATGDHDHETGRCMVLVSPDGERSMNTYLGISSELSSDDVPSEVAGQAQIMFLEGYLFDKDKGKTAFMEAARDCRAGGGKPGIAISDPFCVERHRADFLKLIETELEFVIGNEDEIRSLFETDDLEEALAKTAAICPLVVCTRSGDGVTVVSPDGRIDVSVTKVVPVDATGAGDQFAAGFLFGLAQGRDLETCARMGNTCAAEVISHIGPRPKADMRVLLQEAGLL